MSRRISGERLVSLRGRTTQTDLANALRKRGHGTTQTTVSRWESGQQPHASVLADLAAELGVSVDELYGEDDAEAAPMADIATALLDAVRALTRAEVHAVLSGRS